MSGASRFVATAAVAGAATMVVELGAARVLAPSFGASTAVWTNVIGAILVALALGYALGARVAASRQSGSAMIAVLAAAAVLIAWLPLLARVVGAQLAARFDASEPSGGSWQWGSSLAALILLAPPAALLGCIGPLCVEGLATSQGSSAGRASGAIFAAGTLGSLVGTLLSTHWMFSSWGLEWAYLAGGAVLCAQALLLALTDQRAHEAA